MGDARLAAMLSRNPPFIDGATQTRLGRMTVGLVGCGLASQCAVALARLGVRAFRLWDGDAVDWSNLNRQAFSESQIGFNKAGATADLIRAVNPRATVEAVPSRLSLGDLPEGLFGIDVAVNSADFVDPVLYEVGDDMKRRGGWCIQPLNLGFGGCCLVLGPESPSLETLTGGRQHAAARFIGALLESTNGFDPSPELAGSGPALLSAGDKLAWFPQNVVAALITTSLVTWTVTMIAAGKGRAIQAPRLLHFEPRLQMS